MKRRLEETATTRLRAVLANGFEACASAASAIAPSNTRSPCCAARREPAGARFRATHREAGGKKIRFLDSDATRRFLEAPKGGAHETLYALAITTGMRPEDV